jgi:16S rRNA (adenine1518-N6/adenine1519-N6)-dimethyltransferase
VTLLRVFLRSLYSHRRKNLRGALAAFPNQEHAKAEIDHLLAGLGIDATARAETLDVEQHIRLCHVFTSGAGAC